MRTTEGGFRDVGAVTGSSAKVLADPEAVTHTASGLYCGTWNGDHELSTTGDDRAGTHSVSSGFATGTVDTAAFAEVVVGSFVSRVLILHSVSNNSLTGIPLPFSHVVDSLDRDTVPHLNTRRYESEILPCLCYDPFMPVQKIGMVFKISGVLYHAVFESFHQAF